MDLQHRVEVCKVEQVAHKRSGAGAPQAHIATLSPPQELGEFADSGAIHGSNPAQIEYQLVRARQNLREQSRERGSLIAINNPPLTVNDRHVATILLFQIQLQFRLPR